MIVRYFSCSEEHNLVVFFFEARLGVAHNKIHLLIDLYIKFVQYFSGKLDLAEAAVYVTSSIEYSYIEPYLY